MDVRKAVENAALYMGATLLGNAIIFRFVPRKRTGPSTSPLLPPGWVVGSVWTILFGGMGVARSMLDQHPQERKLLDAFALLCLSYPAYTNGFKSRRVAYTGNFVTTGAGCALAKRLNDVAPQAAAFLLPVVGWVAYATLGMLAEQE